MTLTEAKRIVGSIGFPSKMPGTSYSLPASACLAGAELAKLPGTICSDCYALGGKASYQRPNATTAMKRRLDGITHPRWVDAMVRLLSRLHTGPIRCDLGEVGVRLQRKGGQRWRWNEPGYHRWHDSGDLQSLDHLERIVDVCRATPEIRHWLPTRETSILRRYRGTIPDNLIIRVSATMIDGPAPSIWPHTSTVHAATVPIKSHVCPAPQQNHECGSCRACWSPDVANVSYLKH